MPPLGRPRTRLRTSPVQRAPPKKTSDNDSETRGWMIQIGAPENPAKANALLDPRARTEPFDARLRQALTEKVRKGDATLYRARFAGLDSASAEAACRSLKRTGFSCFPAHDD